MNQGEQIGTVAATFSVSTMVAHAAMAGYKGAGIIIKARAVQIQLRHWSNTAAQAGVGAGNGNGFIPKVDGSPSLTRNIATGPVLTCPRTTHVDPKIGSLKGLSSTLIPRPQYAGQPVLSSLCRGWRQLYPLRQLVARKRIEGISRQLRAAQQAEFDVRVVFDEGVNPVARTGQVPGAFGSRNLRFRALKKKIAAAPNRRMPNKEMGRRCEFILPG